MISCSYDLLKHISQRNALILTVNTPNELGIDPLTLKIYLEELETQGYIKRYTRSYGITPEGTKYLAV